MVAYPVQVPVGIWSRIRPGRWLNATDGSPPGIRGLVALQGDLPLSVTARKTLAVRKVTRT